MSTETLYTVVATLPSGYVAHRSVINAPSESEAIERVRTHYAHAKDTRGASWSARAAGR